MKNFILRSVLIIISLAITSGCGESETASPDASLPPDVPNFPSPPPSVPAYFTKLKAGAGSEHTCAVNVSGGVECWGSNYFGQIGDGTNLYRTTHTQVTGLS